MKIYNSMARSKEDFHPREEGKIGIYVCGMTVYDYCHMGHARVLVAFDVITRYLRRHGFDVNYVRNITDIDDKIINRANENGMDFNDVTEKFIKAMHEDCEALGVLPPNEEPRATEHIDEIIKMIQAIIKNDHAYVADNGDVYYDVNKFDNYGKLARKEREEQEAGIRVNIIDAKRDPLDFALWKVAKPGEPSWDSPWGKGRPGWHIECSAMSTTCLGNHFDIHGGGFDLQFPHHENEIAQSEAATGEKFVDTWMHVGFIQVNKEKMSKSLGNFFTIREVLEKFSPEVIRYFMISSHYRHQLNYTEENLHDANHNMEKLYNTLRGIPANDEKPLKEYVDEFNAAMDDDFNTPTAMGVLFRIARAIHSTEDEKEQRQLAATMRFLGEPLGLLQQDAEAFLQRDVKEELAVQIEQLITKRDAARDSKDWAEADKIRQELTEMGVLLEDSEGKTIWRIN